ncbi:MAG: S8 family serine peptidase [Promethearchaeota archaeon]
MILKSLVATLIIFILISSIGEQDIHGISDSPITSGTPSEKNDLSNLAMNELFSNINDTNTEKNRRVLILFRSEIPAKISIPSLMILHQYHYIPMILLKGTSVDLLRFIQKHKENIQSVSEDSLRRVKTERFEKRNPVDIGATSPAVITGATRLWEMGYRGQGVRIGIIDTGISKTHLDLAGKIVANRSFVNTIYGYSGNITDTNDLNGHGTSMAGIAAGAGIANDTSGTSWPGFAPDAELIVAKIFHSPSLAWEETTSAILAAVEYCVDNDADVINMSFGQYHNLPNEPRQAIINEMTKKGVIFSISAGNEGYSGIEGGSLDNPGTALQGICVANADNNGNIASSSSSGPKIDYSMKPDISAPGIGVMSPDRGTATSFTSISGTSPAAACVSGAAGLLISYLKENSIPYTAGTIKGALLKGAIDHETTPDWREGAGFLNVSRSFDILATAPTLNSYPALVHPHPGKLPFYPTTHLFQGQWLDFNLTLIASPNLDLSISCSPILEPFLQFPPIIEVGNSTLCQIRINIPEDAMIGFVAGELMFNTTSVQCQVLIEFQIEQPIAKVLFDEVHTMITPRYLGSVNYGDENFFYGIFRDYCHMLMDNDILVQPFIRGELTESLLSTYDALILPDPATYVYDSFMDWLDPSNLTSQYSDFSETEEVAIKNYVSSGGGLLLFSLGALRETTYIPELNQILSDEWGIKFKTTTVGRTQIQIEDSSWNLSGYLIYEGTELDISTEKAMILAANDEQKTCIAVHVSEGGGRVLVVGSDLLFDNQGQREGYSTQDTNNRNGSLLFTKWICKVIPGGSISITPSSSETPNNEFPVNWIIISLVAVIGIYFWIERKQRKK